MKKNKDECTACHDYGFILADIDGSGKLEIQRCDQCNVDVSDDDATQAVFALAQAALDLKDVLVYEYAMDAFDGNLQKVDDAHQQLRGLRR